MEAEPSESGSVEALHLARSRLIDAYSNVEAAICLRLHLHGFDPGNQHIGQKVELLKAVKASPKYSKQERAMVGGLLEDFYRLYDIRCDVVHGVLKSVRVDGEMTACFVNPKGIGGCSRVARLVKLDEFNALTERLAKIAESLA